MSEQMSLWPISKVLAPKADRRLPDKALPPIRGQYTGIKQRYPDVILLFRLGDFCEAFHDDAAIVARELGVRLVNRLWAQDDTAAMAGVPYRTIQTAIAALIGKGYRVGLIEQVGDAPTVREETR